jgi:hypothetical protein
LQPLLVSGSQRRDNGQGLQILLFSQHLAQLRLDGGKICGERGNDVCTQPPRR